MTNISYLSFCGTRIWDWLSGIVLAQGLLQGYSQDVSQGCRHMKARLGLEGPLSRWVIHMAVGRRPCGPFLRAPYDMVVGFHQSE